MNDPIQSLNLKFWFLQGEIAILILVNAIILTKVI